MAKKTATATLPAPAAPVREEEPLGTLNSFTTRSAEMVVTQADDAAHRQRLTQYYASIAEEQAARREKLDAERAERQWRAILSNPGGSTLPWESFDQAIRSFYYAHEQATEQGNTQAAADALAALTTFTTRWPLDWVELDRTAGYHVALHPALWRTDGRPPTLRVTLTIDTTDCLGHALLAADEQASAQMPKLDEES